MKRMMLLFAGVSLLSIGAFAETWSGTLVDVMRQDSYLPLMTKSEFCAGCHFGVFGGVVGVFEVLGGT